MNPNFRVSDLTDQDIHFLDQVANQYIQLEGQAMVFRQKGQKVPFQLTQRLEAIEMGVQAELPPQIRDFVYNTVSSHVAQMKQDTAHLADVGERIADDYEIDRNLAQSTKNMTGDGKGLTRNQWHQARRSGRITQDDPGAKNRKIYREINDALAAQAKTAGVSVKEFEETLDRIEHLERQGTDAGIKKAAVMAQKYGIDAEIMDAWSEHSHSYELYKRDQHRQEERVAKGEIDAAQVDHHNVKLDNNSMRKLDIMSAMVEKNQTPWADEKSSDEQLQADDMKGSLHRAFDEVENDLKIQEVTNIVTEAFNPDDD